jgi:hypothetical protein
MALKSGEIVVIAGTFDLVVAASAEHRLDAVLDALDAHSDRRDVLVLATTQAAAEALVHRWAVRRGAMFGVRGESIDGAARRLSRERLALRGLVPAAAWTLEAVVRAVVRSAEADGSLGRLATMARTPGFARKVTSTIDELRRARVGVASLRAAGAMALADLLVRFEAELERARIVDDAGVIEAAAQAAHALPTLSALALVDHAIGSEVEAAFVRALLSRAHGAIATLPPGEDRTEQYFGALGAQRRVLETPGEGALARLQRNLFVRAEPSAQPASREVEFFSAPGEARECVEIAREILDEARRGTPLERIAVAVRSPAVYMPLLDASLERAGLASASEPSAAPTRGHGRALVRLLSCRLESRALTRFVEYLELVGELAPEAAPASSRDASDQAAALSSSRWPSSYPWRLLLRDARVGHDPSCWRDRLDVALEDLSLAIVALEDDDPESSLLDSLRVECAALARLAQFAKPVLEAVVALPVSATCSEFADALASLARLAIPDPEAALLALVDLRTLDGVGPISLGEIMAMLEAHFVEDEPRGRARSEMNVFVGTPDALRGRDFDVVFIPGVTERVFPERPHEDPLLVDAVRAEIGAGGDPRLIVPALAGKSERADVDRQRLRVAVSAARKRVVVSYPRLSTGDEARVRVPSLYAIEVAFAVRGAGLSVAAFERDAADRSTARLSWPACTDPARAIDEVERDLAVIGALLRQEGEDVAGRAAYLLDLNSHLARSLRTRWKKWQPEWSRFDGVVAPSPRTRRALDAIRLSGSARRAEALEEYCACPKRFLLSRVLRVSPRMSLASPRVRHEIKRQALRRAVHGMLGASNTAGVGAELVGPVARVKNSPALVRMAALIVTRLRAMSTSHELLWPTTKEHTFNNRFLTAHASTVGDGQVLLERPDAVLRDRESGALVAQHWKLDADSSRGVPTVHRGGDELEPLFAALAAEVHASGQSEGAIVFSLADSRNLAERRVPLDERSRAAAREIGQLVSGALERGFFPPWPRRDACNACAYRSVCGPDAEARAERKERLRVFDPTLAAALASVRGGP